MKNLRIAMKIRNTHSLKRNLLYYLYERHTRMRSGITPATIDLDRARLLKSTGILDLGIANVDKLAKIVEENLLNVPLKDGYAQLPRHLNPLVVPHLFRVLQEKKKLIEAYYRSHFRVNWFEVQKLGPGRQPSGSSFDYHTDDTPLPIMKLFVYLTDTAESNGAFRAFDYQYTDELLSRGMLESAFPGVRRENAQRLLPPEYDQNLTVVEGLKGTVFIFDNNLIHKGTLPRLGTRTHVSMELMPCATPQTEVALLMNCDEEIKEYFPVNPFRR